VNTLRHYEILLITFGISGFWHGANWTFVIWGLYNGILLIIENMVEKASRGVHLNWLVMQIKRVVVLCAICIGWVFFRAQSLSAAMGILRRMFMSLSVSTELLKQAVLLFTGDSSAMAVGLVTVLLVFCMLLLEKLGEDGYGARWLAGLPQQTLATIAAFNAVMLFGVLQASAFIYFQF
jgi:alginate O-acetyltransferase complex protein AlgI